MIEPVRTIMLPLASFKRIKAAIEQVFSFSILQNLQSIKDFGGFDEGFEIHSIYSFGGGEIIMCALCVPGSMIQGPPGTIGLRGSPVEAAVAQGIYTT